VAYSGIKDDAALDTKAQDVTCVYYVCISISVGKATMLISDGWHAGHQSRCTCVDAHIIVVAWASYAGASMVNALFKIDDRRSLCNTKGSKPSHCVVC
jgi:hypothetical protein